MSERLRQEPARTADQALLEALIDLARSAIANRREAEDRRAKMRAVDDRQRGRAA